MPFEFPDNTIPLESQVPAAPTPATPPELMTPEDLQSPPDDVEPPKLPWDKNSITNSKSEFFPPINIFSDAWNALMPYRLAVIDSSTNQVIVGENSEDVTYNISGVSVLESDILIDFNSPTNKWEFTLPITPQQLTIQDQYSIQTSATLSGVLEEHSGVRFKTIMAQGTFGVWPYRSSVDEAAKRSEVLNIFNAGINALSAIGGNIGGLFNLLTGNPKSPRVQTITPDISPQGPTSTGYYQALKLQQFLEQYAEAKKDPKNANWRLIFNIPKQNQTFVVTPVTYSWRQNVNRPMEINFDFQLRAWRRINIQYEQKPEDIEPSPPTNSSVLNNILNTIDTVRSVISNTLNLIKAVRSNIQRVMEALRKTALFIKHLVNEIKTIIDLPNKILADIKNAWKDIQKIINSTFPKKNEGLPSKSVLNGQIGTSAANANALDPLNKIFDEPEAFYDTLKNVPISQLSVNNSQKIAINNAINEGAKITVKELKEYRSLFLELSLQLSNAFGSNDSYYNKIYKKSYTNTRNQEITLDEYDILKAMYDLISAYDILTATSSIDNLNKKTTIEYVAGLASNSNINFKMPKSKKMVPVPFGLTMEQISARYLKDKSRWLEIATLNGLRDPYIDENGFQLKLLSNGIDRQIIINSPDNLYIGQTVVLNSQTQQPSARIILNIEKLSDTSFLITLDGLANLNDFKFSDNAYLQAYLPGTVNGQQKIFIPSDVVIEEGLSIVAPSKTLKDPLSSISKVDWLLQDSNDLAINNFGDFRYSYGMTNIVQALKIKLGTEAGKVLTHPNFGLTIKPGTVTSDLAIKEIYASINNMIKNDRRFSGISKLQIYLNKGTLNINLAVKIPGQTGIFPVSFQFTR